MTQSLPPPTNRRVWTLTHFGAPEAAFELREEPRTAPAPDQIEIAVEVSGLNFADILAGNGNYADCPPLPCVLGYEVVGRVSKVPAHGKTPLREGDRVAAFTRFGGYASHVLTPAEAAVKIPENLPAAEAAALITQGATAWYMAEDVTRIFPGDRVLVQAAAGGVGQILAQLAKARGAIVYGTASTPEKLEFLARIGVDHPIAYTREDFVDAIAQIQGTSKPKLDLVFDSLGGRDFSRARKLLRAGGRILAFGAASAHSESRNPLKLLQLAWGFGVQSPIPLLMQSKSLIGVNMLKIADERPEVLRRCLIGIIDFWKTGQLKIHVGGVYPTEAIAEAHRALGGRGTTGKLVLNWGSKDGLAP